MQIVFTPSCEFEDLKKRCNHFTTYPLIFIFSQLFATQAHYNAFP